MHIGHLYTFFGERSIQVHFFVGFFVHVSFFVCSEFQPLIKYIICKYFFYSVGCLFILTVSFDAVLNFDVVQFMFLCLLIMLLVLYPRGDGQIHCHEVFPLCFLLRVL